MVVAGWDPLQFGSCFADPPRSSVDDGLMAIVGAGRDHTRVLGQWRLVQGCSGGLSDLMLAHMQLPLHRQAARPWVTVCVEGGAWNLTRCDVYSAQGTQSIGLALPYSINFVPKLVCPGPGHGR